MFCCGQLISWLLAAGVIPFVVNGSEAIQENGLGSCQSGDESCGWSQAGEAGSKALHVRRIAREDDCPILEPECLDNINSSAGPEFVPLDEVMGAVEKVGKDKLHEGALKPSEWLKRFRKSYCETWRSVKFPADGDEAEFRARIRGSEEENGFKVILVHVDGLDDGLGARVKKAVELVVAALRLGLYGVALAIPPSGGLLHPGGDWAHGPVWCHESPADGPEQQHPSRPEYPLVCWRFDFQADLLAQSVEPEGRVLLWGAPPEHSALTVQAIPAPRFNCVRFSKGKDTSLPAGAVWELLRREGPLVRSGQPAEELRRLFLSARAFAAPAFKLPLRKESKCGFGKTATEQQELVHVALHVRRGDVSETSDYAVTQQLGGQGFSKWLCGLAETLGVASHGRKLLLHVHTETAGRSRGALRRAALRGALPGLMLVPGGKDDEHVFHTYGSIEPVPTCGDVSADVHISVNNNPRETLLCMARADVLVTSFSSLGWAAAVLNTGLVFHPDGASKGKATHWDLRDQYLDWADNWFRVSDVWGRKDDVRRAYRAAQEQNVEL